MPYYSAFLDIVKNASLLNLQEFEKFENDTTLNDVGDLGDLAARVTTRISIFQSTFLQNTLDWHFLVSSINSVTSARLNA
jgi:hypothetical protein